VLAALGVNIDADVPCVEACLDELGICFCFAPLMHRAMRHVGPIRKKLGHPTVFNVLGPLVNPAAAPFQLLGVGRPELRPLMAEALAMLGTRRSLVVHGADGLDEVTIGDATYVTEASAEGLLLLGGQLLIAKEQHAVLGERLAQGVDARIVEPLRQVDAENFRAAVGRHLAHFESVDGHPGHP